MSRASAKQRVGCSSLGAFALLGGVIILGFAANGLSLLQSLVALGFGAGVLVLAAMWEWTLRRSAATGPVSRGQRVWNAMVFMAWLVAMVVLVWWYIARGDVPADAP